MDHDAPLLLVEDLKVTLGGKMAVDGASLSIARGEVLGLVGESGCGKTMTALSLIGLVPPEARVSGRIVFDGIDVLDLPEKEIRRIRGRGIAYIFQDPASALNPFLTIGSQMMDAIMAHGDAGREEASMKAMEMLRSAGLPDALSICSAYPHQLSGGMKQRVMIALALSCNPKLIIADEPTTALDTTVQASILALLGKAVRENGISMLLITHDLSIAASLSASICVMYSGRIIEHACTEELFRNPLHPYTKELLHPSGRRLAPPSRSGCPFHPVCPKRMDICTRKAPTMAGVGGHASSCWLNQREGSDA